MFIRNLLKKFDLHTVCEEAKCPNVGECLSEGTATVMIMGNVCTRGCRFCGVETGDPRGLLDEKEPARVAEAVSESGLDYIVLTSVVRDDLPDGGSEHFARTIRAIRDLSPGVMIEVLIPDFRGDMDSLELLVGTRPEVVAHNIEVVRRLSPHVRDRRASYDRSLELLRAAKELAPELLTKSSIMVGLGETGTEVMETMRDLSHNRVDILTIGQYLRPTKRRLPVTRYVSPEEFRDFEYEAREMGFRYVAAGPLVRSSYRAGELYIKGLLDEKR